MSTKKKKSSSMKFLEDLVGEELNLGGLLQAIRLGEEMTQVEFAELLGVSRQFICDVEHRRRFIAPKTAEKFAGKLGYSKEQFVRLSLQDILDREGVDLTVSVNVA
jgi:transcriptional regulator with XRE-family HTH domain